MYKYTLSLIYIYIFFSLSLYHPDKIFFAYSSSTLCQSFVIVLLVQKKKERKKEYSSLEKM
ncbi:uncharacterized protein BX663DRAFT_500051 [Cokeromyces recurvatus]|uniref:uncharacterized protein n=1 Tax=Cokeromyces recurvatus TaxID=90255 RepID=UPI00221FE44D|nr:uncharacterized protein BX663DRAFT_500051 [Cokeromyces recurvatus]KAI7905529.1 hypothetical protein BX663DRAFT_500051 [Cokeromyces recurvatus]